ncbi:MAG: VWA domain-containing protein [Verrucomicrobiaceae bacterium]|nr:VWA domain-containing protein [Verrucomicrobiaceae bacterium]
MKTGSRPSSSLFRPLRRFPASGWLVLIATAFTSVLAVTLNETITTDTNGYRIHYYNRDPSKTDDYVDDENAEKVHYIFDDGYYSTHPLQVDLGFDVPRNSSRDVKIQNKELDGDAAASNNGQRILLPVSTMVEVGYGTGVCQGICIHEHHHSFQFEYMDNDGRYAASTLNPHAFEGPATAMMDALFPSLDNYHFTKDIGYTGIGWFGVYLDPERDGTCYLNHFWDNNGYEGALFWKYLMEQFGTDRDTVTCGSDVLKKFYEEVRDHKEGLTTTLQAVLDAKDRYSTDVEDRGVDLKSVFQDFSIANWTRRYHSPQSWGDDYTFSFTYPSRFYYADEDSAKAEPLFPHYNKKGTDLDTLETVDSMDKERPAATIDFSLAPGDTTGTQSINLDTWAANYVTCDFSIPSTSGYMIGFNAKTESGGKCSYAVVGIRQDKTIDVMEKSTVYPESGNTFSFSCEQPTTNPYVKLVAIFNGQDGPSGDGWTSLSVDAEYDFFYSQPTLTVLEPTLLYRAYVGSGSSPERFTARVRINEPSGTGGASIPGLGASDFEVFVGSTTTAADQATVLACASVMGEYWLTIEPPVKSPPPSASQNLTVRVGNISGASSLSVLYADVQLDQMLVIDRSGSMARTSEGMSRIEAARAAAQLFVDAQGADDQLGVVRFSGDNHEPDATPYGDAQLVASLTTRTTQFAKDLLNLALEETSPAGDKLTPSGNTSIGDGFYQAFDHWFTHRAANAEPWFILLSDGHQNEDSDGFSLTTPLIAEGIRVEAIALGPNCDKNLLQSIASVTSGRYYEVAAEESSSASAASSRTMTAGSSSAKTSSAGSATRSTMRLDLGERFLAASDRSKRRDRLHEETGTLAAGETKTVTLTLTEGGVRDAVLVLYTDSGSAKPSLVITQPDGTTVTAPDAGYTTGSPDPSGHYWDPEGYVIYRIPAMSDGTWTCALSNAGADSFGYRFTVSAHNRAGVQMKLCFAEYHSDATAKADHGLYLRGLPMPVVAVLTDHGGPVRGATISAVISHPEHDAVTLTLRDDGNGLDSIADDGVYAASFTPSDEASGSGGGLSESSPPTITGSYQVHATAAGRDNRGFLFNRIAHGAFHLYEEEQGLGGDGDGDGMPDRYEYLHAGLDATVPDATGDLDGDGITNGDEYHLGTDPLNADTDGGGENDHSEVMAGTNPLVRDDDALRAPLVARVVHHDENSHHVPTNPDSVLRPKSGENVITISMEHRYLGFDVLRSTNPAGPFTLVATAGAASGGVYRDTGLTNGVTYYYRLVPFTAGDHRGVSTRLLKGSPRADCIPPSGSVVINEHAPVTTSTTVALRFTHSTDAVEMRYGNKRDLSAVAWGPVLASVPAHSFIGLAPGKRGTVWVEFRDPEGNTGKYSSSIEYRTASAAGSLIANVIAPADPTNAGVTMTCTREADGEFFQVWSPASGVLDVTMPPGFYSLRFSLRGYVPVVLPHLLVPAGGTCTAGLVTLAPLDSDHDGLADASELLTYLTDRRRADSDGDGFSDGTEVIVLRTDPSDPSSALRVTGESTADPATGAMIITFASVPGVTYGFQYSADLSTWTSYTSGGAPYHVTATATTTTVTLTPDTVPDGRLFLRITVE